VKKTTPPLAADVSSKAGRAAAAPRTAQSVSSTIDLEVTQRINQARMERLNTNLEKLIE
jgi:hypothetical protein